MRKEGLGFDLIKAIVRAPLRRRWDEAGNPIAVGHDLAGRHIEVVLALDDPGYVITVIVRRTPR
ncbi:MAG TPA: hypothetical protein VFY04_09225 [Solirubrobacterales bacterium]|nr:hypothetical protein [Solirubrobacterales bacterium]